jgi:hypothetical protein
MTWAEIEDVIKVMTNKRKKDEAFVLLAGEWLRIAGVAADGEDDDDFFFYTE